MKAKKSYGQHFLTNERLAERIVNSVRNEHGVKHILEVGPGKGILTKYLVRRPENLVVVEADADMVEYLQAHMPSLNGNIIHFDFLRFHPGKRFGEEPFALIGNFPYNISSQILLRMVKFREMIPEMVGMFQREVAERIVARPGSKTYGVISLLVQAFYRGKILYKVEKGSFYPPPKVQSAVIRLVRKDDQPLGCDYRLFRQVVKTAFNQRRKMVRNTMKTFLKGSDVLQDPFFDHRPEQLSLADFVRLTNLVAEQPENS